ncbi:peptidoglycan editing factor PgeF [Kangiella sp. HD9-110m-PIT-SAG07]|nr:peptidoglycan editing factor PgeF [Kangiella sp. HD9-110m-PIT-SAG07]
MPLKLIQPSWTAPTQVKAFSTTRAGGYSEAPWNSLNLALHVGDKTQTVEQNRERLTHELQIPNPHWLRQTHSTTVVRHSDSAIDADACFTTQPRQTCVVMTADCLPILLCSEVGDWVSAVHAGWRGLANGMIYESVKQYQGDSPLMAWIGPAISQEHFEVGCDVYEEFTSQNTALSRYFKPNDNKTWQCDLASIAQYQLEQLQLEQLRSQGKTIQVFQSGLCSYHDSDNFYSHRRASHEQGANATTGRMASVIWIEQ